VTNDPKTEGAGARNGWLTPEVVKALYRSWQFTSGDLYLWIEQHLPAALPDLVLRLEYDVLRHKVDGAEEQREQLRLTREDRRRAENALEAERRAHAEFHLQVCAALNEGRGVAMDTPTIVGRIYEAINEATALRDDLARARDGNRYLVRRCERVCAELEATDGDMEDAVRALNAEAATLRARVAELEAERAAEPCENVCPSATFDGPHFGGTIAPDALRRVWAKAALPAPGALSDEQVDECIRVWYRNAGWPIDPGHRADMRRALAKAATFAPQPTALVEAGEALTLRDRKRLASIETSLRVASAIHEDRDRKPWSRTHVAEFTLDLADELRTVLAATQEGPGHE
jgi:hypothetical protein